MAAALLNHALAAQPEPLRSLKAISAGVAARAGEAATDHSVTALKKVGLDLSGHRSRPVTQGLLDDSLVVLCMTEPHRASLEARADPVPRVHLFREFMPDGSEREIADPYGGPLPLYEASRDEMVEALPSLIEFLRTLVVAKA